MVESVQGEELVDLSDARSDLRGWEVALVGDVATFIRGVTYRKADARKVDVEGLIPILRATNIQGELNISDLVYVPSKFVKAEQYIKRDDVVIAMSSGSVSVVGKAAQARTDIFAAHGAFCGVLRPAKWLNGRFFGYLFSTMSYRQAVSALAKGSNINNLKIDHLASFPLPIPPLAEQRRIVSRIEELFSKIEAGERAIEQARKDLKRYRKAVLKAAVTGALTEDWRAAHPPTETGDELLARILEERREVWVAAELAKLKAKGKSPQTSSESAKLKARYKQPLEVEYDFLSDVPASWATGPVEAFGLVQLGRQRAPKHHEGDHMRPYLRVANVFEDRIDTSDIMRMNFTPAEFEVYGLKVGDVLLNEGQSAELVGRPAIYKGELPGGCFTNTLVRFRTCSGLKPEFSLMVFRHFLHSGYFTAISRITTNIAHLGAERFASMNFPLPPLDEQTEIVSRVEEALSRADAAEATLDEQARAARALRQSILKAAFTGRLVPQDPNDEPASELLKRVKESGT